MAKKTAAKAVEMVEIRYDLFDLPTAQHKAGLAGLVLAIRSLKERSDKDPKAILPQSVPEIIEEPDDTSVKIRFTRRSVKGLFDDLYDADLIESEPREKPRTKGKGAAKQEIPAVRMAPLRVVNKKTGHEEEVEGYVYLDVTPRLAPLAPLFPPIPEWLKLWRNVLFQAIRDGRKQAPYKKRAAERFRNSPEADAIVGSEGESDTSEEESGGNDEGSSLDELENDNQGKLSSALYIGAQGVNAEQVSFTGSNRFNFLLHFWPLSMVVFVPAFIDSDGKEHLGKRSEKDKSSHYVVAIPEVSGLRRFCELYPRVLSRLGDAKRGYRPARAIIAVAAQSSLEFINHVAVVAEQTAEELLSRALNSVEYYHLMKPDPNRGAVLVGSGRVSDDPDLIAGYRDIIGRPGEFPSYRNPLFRAALILALLRGKPWWAEILPLFMTRDVRFFFPAEDAPTEIDPLARDWTGDVRHRFKVDEEKHQHRRRLQMQMSENDPQPSSEGEKRPKPSPRPLDLIIHDIARQYVLRRAEAREKNLPRKNDAVEWASQQAQKAKAEAARDAFLALRSRRDNAFIEHFTALFGQFGQFLMVPDEFLTLTTALRDETDRVKTVTLLALSANGYVRKAEAETTTSEDKA